MGLNLKYNDGQTPIDDDEREGLLISTITTMVELDEFEQQNIEDAIVWISGKKFAQKEIFTEAFVKRVHKRMYGNVWNWAGEFRKTNKNIGVDKYEIAVELKKLLNDSIYWLDQQTFSPEETALRFKHRLVSIHCFPNGNGRHSRLMADIIIAKLYNLPEFSWGAENLTNEGSNRNDYINALKKADNGDYKYLIEFAKS